MQALLNSGRLVDFALAVTALEVLVLTVLRRRALHPAALAGQLLAGVMLLLALRSALRGEDYRWTLFFFSASLPAHLYDLLQRARAS